MLRRLSYRLQQRQPGPMPPFLSAAHLAAVMEPGFPYMRALFKPERVADEEAFNRIATLAFLAPIRLARRVPQALSGDHRCTLVNSTPAAS